MKTHQQKTALLTPEQIEGLPRIGLRARHVVEGFLSGLHRGRRFGWSLEFAGHREYVPGDDLRTLDWKAFGRTDRFFIKRYEEETSLRVSLLLDCSGSMGFASRQSSKLRFTSELAAALAYLVIRQKDQAGLGWFSENSRNILAPHGSPSHLRRIWEELEKLEPQGEVDFKRNFNTMASELPRRGVLVLLTDAFISPGDLESGLRYFKARKFDLILLQVLDPAERDFPFRGQHRFKDLETEQVLSADSVSLRSDYLAALAAHQQQIQDIAFRSGVDFHTFYSDMPIERALFRFLSRRRRLRR
jgi:uncharacterized protein (DUF58 family)